MDTLIRRIDMAVADIHTQLDRVRKVASGYETQRSVREDARESARVKLERQREALQVARERAGRLRVQIRSAPSAKEMYEMDRETAEIERAYDMCCHETEDAEREVDELAQRTEEADARLRRTVAFCEKQRERTAVLRGRMGAVERAAEERRVLAAARMGAELEEAKRREDALTAVRESVTLQRRLRVGESERVASVTAVENDELTLAASKMRILALEYELAGVQTRLAGFRERWGEKETALANLRQKKIQYEKMTERLCMENAEMEARWERSTREQRGFDAVVRESEAMEARRCDHEDAIFAQFVRQCDRQDFNALNEPRDGEPKYGLAHNVEKSETSDSVHVGQVQ